MSERSKVNWLLVGTGDIANKRVAPALVSAQESSLVGVCDVVGERAEQTAKQFKAGEIYTDFDDALAKTSANAAYLATPVALHSAQAAAVLESGRHVLVEKPLAVSADDAAAAVRAAEGKDLRAGCAYFRRCTPRYTQAAEMLAAGEFGQVVLVRMTYFSWFNPEPDDPKFWRVVKAASGGGPLSDMGSHMFDVLIGLLGMPKTVMARCENLVHRWEVEDSSVLIMTLESGAQTIASFHWNSKTWSHEFEIVGTEAKVKWHPYDSGPVVKTVGRDISQLDLPGAENVHLPLVEDFVRAVIDGRDPIVPLAEAAKSNRLLDAVYESAETGREVQL